MNRQLKEADVMDYSPSSKKVEMVAINQNETQQLNYQRSSSEILRERLVQIKKADKTMMNMAEKVDYQKELYNITYQLNKENKMASIPMAVIIIAIILLTLLL